METNKQAKLAELMALVDRLVSEAHQTASAESGSVYADIKGPAAEAKARATLSAALEAVLAAPPSDNEQEKPE